MTSEQTFGGDWTIEKLEILSSYLDAYLTALQAQPFKKIYIDAFAGTGVIKLKNVDDEVVGSAQIALMALKKFDFYYFIEKDNQKAEALKNTIQQNFPHLINRTEVLNGDANQMLSELCSQINWIANRALLFLDPCATEVAWSTLQTVGNTKAIDVWYLFPFLALQRMLPNNGIKPEWCKRINRLLGDEGWQEEFYKEEPQMNIFGTTSQYKNINTESLEKYILTRLNTVFPAVAPNPRIFRNSNHSPMFLFCFAVSNDNPKAQQLALRIANHILKPKE